MTIPLPSMQIWVCHNNVLKLSKTGCKIITTLILSGVTTMWKVPSHCPLTASRGFQHTATKKHKISTPKQYVSHISMWAAIWQLLAQGVSRKTRGNVLLCVFLHLSFSANWECLSIKWGSEWRIFNYKQ